MRSLLLALAVLAVALIVPDPARAQDGGPRRWELLRPHGDGAVAVETSWSAPDAAGKRKASVAVRALGADLAPAGDPIPVFDGPTVLTAVAADAGAAAVVLYNGSAQPFVKVALVDLAKRSARVVELPRTAGADYAPSAALVTADDGGFAILWQEEKRSDAGAEALSTLARVKADGSLLLAPKSVAVPWSLGAIAFDGRGYTLAVNFDGAAPDQTRVCFVTLTREGAPEQHPWWGSRPGMVSDVQLVRTGAKVSAAWRGGADGNAILSAVVDPTGQWGRDPAPAAVLAGHVDASVAYAARVKNGVVQIVKR